MSHTNSNYSIIPKDKFTEFVEFQRATLATHAIPFKTKNLFSQHYFKDILIHAPNWKKDEHKDRKTFEEIKKLYLEKKKLLGGLNESQLEEDFIRPILKILGHIYDVQPSIRSVSGTFGRPDYAFFANDENKNEIKEDKETDYFRSVIGIGEAKPWGTNLDKREIGKPSPSSQINIYLRVSDVRWGILTNGRLWRLYCKETSFNLDSYYEIDLVNLIEHGDTNDFKYFYLLFRRDAFVPHGQGKCFLDDIFEKNVRFAKELEEDIKKNVYDALKLLVKGFLKYQDNNLSWYEEDIKKIHANTLILLYRILFILYAEARDLLPTENEVYKSISLEFLKKEIAEKIDNGVSLHSGSSVYWAHLEYLFDLLNARKIQKDELFVPPYNGRLFDPDKYPFLKDNKVGDKYLAEAINLLTRRNNAFIDYQTLGIRQLGSIYEGLLECKLRIAEEDFIITKEKGKKGYQSVKKAKESGKKIDKNKVVNAGDLYLVTDKGERKATGSYYTPDYIVKYIVENTLGPLVEAMKRDVGKNGGNLIEELLSIKILDPAMGSGHFLLEAVSFLAREIVEALEKQGKVDTGGEEDEITWAKRQVVERCIYGVDLNLLAVELAKVSLWLHTISKDEPLAFLDHHLRCGNSLIGAKIDDVGGVLPNAKIRSKKKEENRMRVQQTIWDRELKETMKSVLSKFAKIEQMPSNTIERIKQKERIHENIIKMIQRFKEVADVYVSIYFENDVPSDEYREMLQSISSSNDEWDEFKQRYWFKSAIDIAKEKSFFHWELEFPEVFFEEGEVKENQGWDCVVGNPPYDVLAEKELGYSVEQEKLFFKSKVEFYPAKDKKLNLYRLFIAKGLALTKEGMRLSFIIPMAILGDDQATRTRKWMLNNFQIEQIEAFPQKDDPYKRVFFEAKLPTAIVVVTKDKPTRNVTVTTHPGRLFKEVSKCYKLDQNKIKSLDAHSFSIPLMNAEECILCERIFLSSWVKRIGDQYHSYQGEINETSMKQFLIKEPIGPEILRGGIVQRYELLNIPKQGEKWYLNIDKYYTEVSDKSRKAHVDSWRIGYQRNAALDNYRRIISTIIPPKKHLFDSISYLIPEDEEKFFLLAILNSNLLEFRFRLTSTNNHVNGYEIEALPLRRISFTTPLEERTTILESLKSKYRDNESDKILKIVEECLPKDEDGNFITEKEKSDVIHDLLAFLAERMIGMNKEKKEETKGFLEWLEREIKTEIDKLTNRTKLKAYYELEFDELLKILKKNKKKISITVSNWEFRDNLKKEFEKSKVVLSPLRNKIGATDKLINQIVYKLYGLTDEEIKIVESSLSKDSNENRNDESAAG